MCGDYIRKKQRHNRDPKEVGTPKAVLALAKILKVYRIVFRNGKWSKITRNSLIEFAFYDHKMYFREGREGYGYMLSNWSKDRLSCSFRSVIGHLNFVGDYDLKYDKEEGFYYIDEYEKRGGEIEKEFEKINGQR